MVTASWQALTSQADLDQLMNIFGGFHDGCIREAHAWTEHFVNPGLSMSCSVMKASSGGRPDYDVLGDSVNVAQRIESAAEPGTVCVSEPFYRITQAAFEYRDRGSARVKGKPEPLPVRIGISDLHITVPRAKRMNGIAVVGHEVALSHLTIDGSPLTDVLIGAGAQGAGGMTARAAVTDSKLSGIWTAIITPHFATSALLASRTE